MIFYILFGKVRVIIQISYICDMKNKRIAIGLSGGVDSSVAALLLKNEGYDVFALFMQNWNDASTTLHGDCEWEEDLNVAKMVAKRIGIPFHYVDLSVEYKKRVVDYMFSEYEKGRTPNPDVLCNKEIKFDAFVKAAQELGAEYVATGHYCRKEMAKDSDGNVLRDGEGNIIYKILAGVDDNKDQTYFLCQLSQSQLAKALFPIGHLTKPEVRRIAMEAALPSAEKKDSQGICFVGKVFLPVFLQQKLAEKVGDVVEIYPEFYDKIYSQYPGYGDYEGLQVSEIAPSPETRNISSLPIEERIDFLTSLTDVYRYQKGDGKVIGKHNGAHFYTIGQRKGLNIGGHKESIFIISTDIETNTIYVGEGHHHPGLLRKGLRINADEIHWIREDLSMSDGESIDLLVRIRYRQPLQKATLYFYNKNLFIIFEEYQRGITPGQFAVWYSFDLEMIGSGVIE